MKNQIVTKSLYPGNRIIEEDLARETGVSRTPIRSALVRLAYEGLVVQQPNKGSFVAKPSATDLRQVYETRAVLEVGAFRAALKRRSDESVLLMEKNMEKQRQLGNIFNMSDYVGLNREFHWIITMEAQNAYYEKYLNELHNRVATYLLFWDNSTTNEFSLETHQKILDAFRDRNEEKGVEALLEDIGSAEDIIRKSQQL